MSDENENEKNCKDCKHLIPIEGNPVFSGYCHIGIKEHKEHLKKGTCSKFTKKE